MARKFLVVVDMQDDFVYGALKNQEAIKIVPSVVEKIKEYDGSVYLTRDTHKKNYMETQEGQLLPVPHCIAYSDGWEFIDQIEEMRYKSGFKVFQKDTFGCVNLAIELRAEHIKQSIEEIELIGVCTDVCVISNALLLKAYMPDVPIVIDASCCAGVTPESHRNAIVAMENCQIKVINKSEREEEI